MASRKRILFGCYAMVLAIIGDYLLGFGTFSIHAGPAPLYIRKRLCTEGEIAAALKDLVSGKYDKGAEAASKEILKEDGVKEAADVIEAYIGKTHEHGKS